MTSEEIRRNKLGRKIIIKKIGNISRGVNRNIGEVWLLKMDLGC